jgi:flagellar export protein FliJ
MKRFEFRLHRVLDLRRQQADIHRHRLQTLTASLAKLDAEKSVLEAKVAEARTSVKAASVTGSDLVSLAHYEAHIRRCCARVAQKRSEVERQLESERSKTREVERRVKLLEKLEAKKRAEWESEANKEIETLSADSYLSRLQSAARK